MSRSHLLHDLWIPASFFKNKTEVIRYSKHKPLLLTNWKAFRTQAKFLISKSSLFTSLLCIHMHSGKDNHEDGYTPALCLGPSPSSLFWMKHPPHTLLNSPFNFLVQRPKLEVPQRQYLLFLATVTSVLRKAEVEKTEWKTCLKLWLEMTRDCFWWQLSWTGILFSVGSRCICC